MARDFHTIILGLGAMGTAAAAHLARRLHRLGQGDRVLGLEQFDIPHARGSSHGQSRLIRLAYYELPDYVPLLRRSYTLWRELQAAVDTPLLHLTGGLYLGPESHELIAGSLRSAQQHELPHELLTRAALKRRYPQFELPPGFTAFFEPDAGFLQPEKAVAAHALLALRHGAELHAHEPALEWTADDHEISVRTPLASYRARRLVITAGPWTARAVPFLAGSIRVTRQPMVWFWPHDPDAFLLGRFPCWCAAADEGGLVYGPPMLPGDLSPLGLKVSHHFPARTADPDHVELDFLPGDSDVPRAMLQRLLPLADGPVMGHRVCLYSNSPDHHFLIDQHPHHAAVTIAAGFSGHGFKFAPVIGEILADLALDGQTRHPIDFLRLHRINPPS
jgi:sarcosine oxidase